MIMIWSSGPSALEMVVHLRSAAALPLLLAVLLALPRSAAADGGPEQFHVSYAPRRSGLWVTWVVPAVVPAGDDDDVQRQRATADRPPHCEVVTTAGGTPTIVHASNESYTDNAAGCRSDKSYGGPCVPWAGQIHTALLADLPLPGTLLRYSCGTAGAMSGWRNVTSPRIGGDTVSFALLGDQGTSMHNVNGGMEKYNHTYPGAIFVRDELIAAGLVSNE